MAEKNVQMAPQGTPQSATVASGSTHSAGNVMVSWTTTLGKQAVVTTLMKLTQQLMISDDADLDW